MLIKCAWCGKYLGMKEPFEDGRITHSICLECYRMNYERLMKELERRKEERGYAL